jgi:hypothetical protein
MRFCEAPLGVSLHHTWTTTPACRGPREIREHEWNSIMTIVVAEGTIALQRIKGTAGNRLAVLRVIETLEREHSDESGHLLLC